MNIYQIMIAELVMLGNPYFCVFSMSDFIYSFFMILFFGDYRAQFFLYCSPGKHFGGFKTNATVSETVLKNVGCWHRITTHMFQLPSCNSILATCFCFRPL